MTSSLAGMLLAKHGSNGTIGALANPTTQNGQSAAALATTGRLTFEAVSKHFSSGTAPALQEINLACESGEFVVVVGPSGCGKSTLLNLAAGMLRPDR